MTCPLCGGEMESGYLAARPPVLWSNKPRRGILIPGKHDLLLHDLNGEPPLTAHLCCACRKVIVEF